MNFIGNEIYCSKRSVLSIVFFVMQHTVATASFLPSNFRLKLSRSMFMPSSQTCLVRRLSSSSSSDIGSEHNQVVMTSQTPSVEEDYKLDPLYIKNSRTRHLLEQECAYNVAQKVVSCVIARSINDGGCGSGTSPILKRIGSDNPDIPIYRALFSRDHATTFDPPYQNYLPTAENELSKTAGSRNFAFQLAYRGDQFRGWQMQRPDLEKEFCTVQGKLVKLLETHLRPENSLSSKALDVRCAGRTDASVSAIGQICRVRTKRRNFGPGKVNTQTILNAINTCSDPDEGEPSLYCIRVDEVHSSFHPTFCASSRAYIYLIDLESDQNELNESHVGSLDKILKSCEGVELDYFGMSHGKVKTETTLCTLKRSRASLVEYCAEENPHSRRRAVCIELIGDRFLRRMVRKIVGTAIREILSNKQIVGNELIDVVLKKDRKLSGYAAPSSGLIFVGAYY